LAEIALDRATKMRPDFAPIYAQRAAIAVAKGRMNDAAIELQKGLDLDPLEDKLWLMKGHIAIQAGDFDTAIPALKRTLELNKAHVQGAYLLSHALYQSGDYSEAERVARSGMVYARNPDTIAQLNEMIALSLMRQNRFESAKIYLLDILGRRPADERIKKLLAACEQKLKNP
jgi:predicted Zn-dependent protease